MTEEITTTTPEAPKFENDMQAIEAAYNSLTGEKEETGQTDPVDSNAEENSQAQLGEGELPPEGVEPLAPHPRWDESTRERFSKAPREWQEWALERENEVSADHTRKTQEIAEVRRRGEAFDEVLRSRPADDAPSYGEQLQMMGLTAPEALHRQLAWNQWFDRNPVDALDAIIQTHPSLQGFSLRSVFAQGTQQQPSFQRDPALLEIQRKQQEIEEHINRQSAERAQIEQQNLESHLVGEITRLAEEKHANGQPVRPLFRELSTAIQGVIYQMMMEPEHQEKPPSVLIDEAYRKVATPVMDQRRTQNAERVQKARLAGSSIVSNGTGVSMAPKRAKTDREAIEMAYEKITNSR